MVWLRTLQQDPAFSADYLARGGGPQYVRVKAHLVGKENYSSYYKIQSLLESFCRLNGQYEETGFYFFFDYPLDIIEDDRWWSQTFSDGYDMIRLNNVDGALNVYYVGNIESGTIAGYFSPGADGVVMANSASSPTGNTLAHEFGHFFSLPHTFYGWEWGTPSPAFQERVDGSNCNTAGDGFCDTPPDYAPYRWSCPSVGPFVDPNGVSFLVTDSFYMSYGGNECLLKFSPLQSAAMRANLNIQRPSLIGSLTPNFPDGYDSVQLISPANGSTLLPPRGQVFNWSKVPGAVAYHISIAYTTLFSAIAEESIVLDTVFTALRLSEDRNFYWRVKPLFEGNTCEPYSDFFSFRTGEQLVPVSGLSSTVLDENIQVYPNPVQAGSNLMVKWPVTGSSGFEAEMTWQILGVTGNAIAQGQYAPGGETSIAAPNLPGLYFLVVSGSKGAMWRTKIIVGS